MVAIFWKRPRFLRDSIVLLHKNARHLTPNWTEVYGCTSDRLWVSPILHSVFYLSLNPWETPGWQGIAIGAPLCYRYSTTTLEYMPSYHCGAMFKMVVVMMLRSDAYHLLHMCHVFIKVTITFGHESVCYLIFLNVLCVYIAVWAGDSINTGYSEWWGLCVICW